MKRFAENLGADLFGVADLKSFRPYEDLDTSLIRFLFGLSIGVRLSNPIVDRIGVEDPTPEYASQYKAVNALLDDVAVRIANFIQREGMRRCPYLPLK